MFLKGQLCISYPLTNTGLNTIRRKKYGIISIFTIAITFVLMNKFVININHINNHLLPLTCYCHIMVYTFHNILCGEDLSNVYIVVSKGFCIED